MNSSCFISEEEEQALLSGTFPKTIDDHINELEMSIKEMDIHSTSQHPSFKPDGHLHGAYKKLHAQVDMRIIQNLRIALDDIPQDTEGLDECKKLLSLSEGGNLTLQDVLMIQYVLNGGLFMRQHHGCDDEYGVDIS